MSFIDNLKARAKENKKTIVIPESMDERVLNACEIILEEDISNLIIIGNKDVINNNYKLDKAYFIDPSNYELLDEMVEEFIRIRNGKINRDQAYSLLLNDYMYFACMLVKIGKADGVVSGACHSTSNTLRPALQIIKTAPEISLASAFFLMDVPNCSYGSNGVFVFADSGLQQNPNSTELAEIAINSAKSLETIVLEEAKVAFLSHSTKGSASHNDVDKVLDALNIAKLKSNYKMDGELQLDAAIIPEIAQKKAPNSEVAGYANVLIFPDLDAGNIGYKLVERLAHAKAYGPIVQGLNKPINDLSRGCSVEDIVGVVTITCLQAQK